MTAAVEFDWEAANQSRLAAEVARVRALVELHLDPESTATAQEPVAVETDGPDAAIVDHVAAAFHLSPFERDVLLLAAGVELDGTFAELCARSDHGLGGPNFSLALAALPGAHWSALSPAGPLRYWRLVELTPAGSLVTASLRIDERVLHYLAGVHSLDERLRPIARPLAAEPLTPEHARVVRQLAGCLESGRHVELAGGDADSRRNVAAAAAGELASVALAVAAADVPPLAAEREQLARLLDRETVLGSFVVVLDVDETTAEQASATAELAAMLRSPSIVTARERLRAYRRPISRVDLPPLSTAERERILRAALGTRPGESLAEAAAAAQQFQLDATSLTAAVEQLVANGSADTLWDALRVVARPSLDDLAQRIEPVADWDQLVLPHATVETLRQIVVHVRRRARVYEDWGFARTTARGLGISALFAGPSGTGKTTAAEMLARELRLDLYRVDLSAVVSKYIGETEKNLRRVFDAADQGGVILLFDEADALFGKRSEVKDSHDRYANIEVSYLLQRMEAYRGLAILTTNRRSALDPAFLRRLRFVVEFPFPNGEQRAEIWRRIFPADTPVGDLDPVRLAQLNVTGGTIRNIALAAAYFAADADVAVRMDHALRAARGEYAKLERPLADAEIGGWT